MSLITELQEKAAPSIPLNLKELPFVPSDNPAVMPPAAPPDFSSIPQLPNREAPPLPEVPLRAPIEPVQLYSGETVDSITAGITDNFNNFVKKQQQEKPPNVVEQSINPVLRPLQVDPTLTSQQQPFNRTKLTPDQRFSLQPRVVNGVVNSFFNPIVDQYIRGGGDEAKIIALILAGKTPSLNNLPLPARRGANPTYTQKEIDEAIDKFAFFETLGVKANRAIAPLRDPNASALETTLNLFGTPISLTRGYISDVVTNPVEALKQLTPLSLFSEQNKIKDEVRAGNRANIDKLTFQSRAQLGEQFFFLDNRDTNSNKNPFALVTDKLRIPFLSNYLSEEQNTNISTTTSFLGAAFGDIVLDPLNPIFNLLGAARRAAKPLTQVTPTAVVPPTLPTAIVTPPPASRFALPPSKPPIPGRTFVTNPAGVSTVVPTPSTVIEEIVNNSPAPKPTPPTVGTTGIGEPATPELIARLTAEGEEFFVFYGYVFRRSDNNAVTPPKVTTKTVKTPEGVKTVETTVTPSGVVEVKVVEEVTALARVEPTPRPRTITVDGTIRGNAVTPSSGETLITPAPTKAQLLLPSAPVLITPPRASLLSLPPLGSRSESLEIVAPIGIGRPPEIPSSGTQVIPPPSERAALLPVGSRSEANEVVTPRRVGTPSELPSGDEVIAPTGSTLSTTGSSDVVSQRLAILDAEVLDSRPVSDGVTPIIPENVVRDLSVIPRVDRFGNAISIPSDTIPTAGTERAALPPLGSRSEAQEVVVDFSRPPYASQIVVRSQTSNGITVNRLTSLPDNVIDVPVIRVIEQPALTGTDSNLISPAPTLTTPPPATIQQLSETTLDVEVVPPRVLESAEAPLGLLNPSAQAVVRTPLNLPNSPLVSIEFEPLTTPQVIARQEELLSYEPVRVEFVEPEISYADSDLPPASPQDITMFDNVSSVFNNSEEFSLAQRILGDVIDGQPVRLTVDEVSTVLENPILLDVIRYAQDGEVTVNISILRGADELDIERIVNATIDEINTRDLPEAPKLPEEPIVVPEPTFTPNIVEVVTKPPTKAEVRKVQEQLNNIGKKGKPAVADVVDDVSVSPEDGVFFVKRGELYWDGKAFTEKGSTTKSYKTQASAKGIVTKNRGKMLAEQAATPTPVREVNPAIESVPVGESNYIRRSDGAYWDGEGFVLDVSKARPYKTQMAARSVITRSSAKMALDVPPKDLNLKTVTADEVDAVENAIPPTEPPPILTPKVDEIPTTPSSSTTINDVKTNSITSPVDAAEDLENFYFAGESRIATSTLRESMLKAQGRKGTGLSVHSLQVQLQKTGAVKTDTLRTTFLSKLKADTPINTRWENAMLREVWTKLTPEQKLIVVNEVPADVLERLGFQRKTRANQIDDFLPNETEFTNPCL